MGLYFAFYLTDPFFSKGMQPNRSLSLLLVAFLLVASCGNAMCMLQRIGQTQRCNGDQVKLYILLNATQSIRVPSQRWRISHLLEDRTRETLYREQLLSFQSNKSYSFEYCVPIDMIYLQLESPFVSDLNFTHRPLKRRSVIMTVFVESVYLFSLSLHSETRIVRIPCWLFILW